MFTVWTLANKEKYNMGAMATIRNFFLHRKKRIKAESEYIYLLDKFSNLFRSCKSLIFEWLSNGFLIFLTARGQCNFDCSDLQIRMIFSKDNSKA